LTTLALGDPMPMTRATEHSDHEQERARQHGADQAAGLVQKRAPVLDRAAQTADAQATSTQSANTIVE
jgi:hypothetical protein